MLDRLFTRLVRAAMVAAAARWLLRFLSGRFDSSPRTSRRDFLRWSAAGAGTFVLAESAAAFVAFYWPLKTGAFGSKITVDPSNVPAIGKDPIVNRDGRFWLINNPDGALALYWKCVHLGCTVPWNSTEGDFHCPCHGSVYDRHGNHVAGPAPRALDYMEITVEGGKVVVNSGEITKRQQWQPSQSVKLPGSNYSA
ncbi:MAG TPA: ubiquinol-cytochrome c reductase iron-sulfur subunit [Thermomicrobiales bacterium]|nr:ubiquinol-cytochrome c reductase iron-sulfur subunit [Thermomicrobiales bacterium]